MPWPCFDFHFSRQYTAGHRERKCASASGLSREGTPVPRPRKSDHAHVTGMVWATRVTSIAMQMAVPAGLGYLADRTWGLTPWLTIVGACIGFGLFTMEIVRLAQGVSPSRRKRSPSERPERDRPSRD